ncbi:MAG: NAD(P)-dependent oxidoreductase [candidate division WOR-3 bacterium]
MIAVFGSTGTLGTALRKTLKNAKFHTRKDFDVENIRGLEGFLEKFLDGVSVVINSIAYTNVSLAEKERERCYNINFVFPKILAEFCERNGIKLIHISTDYVFDGKVGLYTEDDKPNPISWYGKTKTLSEEAVLSICTNSYVIRTSWVFGENGKNFFSTMPLKLIKNEDIYTHDEQLVCPTPADFLAKNILKVLEKSPGIYHITGKTPITPFEGTVLIKDAIRSNSKIYIIKPDLAIRPKTSILLDTKLNIEKPPFVESILEYIKTLKTSPSEQLP